jgi:galactokinase
MNELDMMKRREKQYSPEKIKERKKKKEEMIEFFKKFGSRKDTREEQEKDFANLKERLKSKNFSIQKRKKRR